jgi:hypothetical protein
LRLRIPNFLRSPAVLMAVGVAATLVLALVVVTVLLRAGGSKAVSDNAGLIGALVALGGVFTAQMVGIALDDPRARETRELEDQRSHEAALRNYLDDVGNLLIEKPLRESSPGDNLSIVVRVQTLSVLGGLDPYRKRILLLFLYESGLIYKDKPVVSLSAADLRWADLSETELSRADLSRANLGEANLSQSNLGEANLSGAYLSGAYLRRIYLSGAYLSGADLSGANLSGANLGEANLSRADLSRANLSRADLGEADLSEADLGEADLDGANLSGAKEITNEELAQQAFSLEGATMPNGQKYEEWLKDREGRKNE